MARPRIRRDGRGVDLGRRRPLDAISAPSRLPSAERRQGTSSCRGVKRSPMRRHAVGLRRRSPRRSSGSRHVGIVRSRDVGTPRTSSTAADTSGQRPWRATAIQLRAHQPVSARRVPNVSAERCSLAAHEARGALCARPSPVGRASGAWPISKRDLPPSTIGGPGSFRPSSCRARERRRSGIVAPHAGLGQVTVRAQIQAMIVFAVGSPSGRGGRSCSQPRRASSRRSGGRRRQPSAPPP